MTALEALVQHTQNHDHLQIVRTDHQPVPVRPPRFNLAGYCVMCLDHGCISDGCRVSHEASVWAVCRGCDGSGYNASTGRFCDCESGLVDLTRSAWPDQPLPRPPRLNFAGWCLWCSDRWCTNHACINRHPRSVWAVCHRCDGHGFDELTADACGCAHGLVESQRTQ